MSRGMLVGIIIWTALILGRPERVAGECGGAGRDGMLTAYCTVAHLSCRSAFGLTADEFAARFGTSIQDCKTLTHDFVETTLVNLTIDPETGSDPELDNCYWALLSVESAPSVAPSCEEIATDALLSPGRACDPEVIAGRRTTGDQYPECGLGDDVGCL